MARAGLRVFARSCAGFVAGANFVRGAALLQGQEQISWQAPRSRKVRYRFRGRRRQIHFVAGAALSQGEVQISWQAQQISWQAQHFRKVSYRFCGRRSTFPRSGTDFVAGAALSQVRCRFRGMRGFAQVRAGSRGFARVCAGFAAGAALLQVRCRFRGRRSTFARSGTDFVVGAALSQGQVQISWQAQHFCKVRHRFHGSRSTFTSAHRREPAPTGAEPERTCANRCEPVRTCANQSEPVRTGANLCEPVRTGAHGIADASTTAMGTSPVPQYAQVKPQPSRQCPSLSAVVHMRRAHLDPR